MTDREKIKKKPSLQDVENKFIEVACSKCRGLRKDDDGENCRGCQWTRGMLYKLLCEYIAEVQG